VAHNKDYIPDRDAEFDGWLDNLTSFVDSKVTSGAWTHIPADKVAALKQHNTDWHTAYAKTLGTHTAVDTEAKNDQRKAAIMGFDAQDPYGSGGRIDGFKDAVKDFKIDYVARGDAHMPDRAIAVATDFLTANPDIDIFYCASEITVLGAVTAIKSSGRAGKVFVFGVDCSVQLAEMLLADDNILQIVTAQDPYLQGQYAVQTMYDYVVDGALVTRRNPASVKAFADNWKARSGE
jgi:ABC-type sugar transport system substrate-binding protein